MRRDEGGGVRGDMRGVGKRDKLKVYKGDRWKSLNQKSKITEGKKRAKAKVDICIELK